MSSHKRNKVKLGSFMTKILRHEPDSYGVHIDEYGYCDVRQLLKAIQTQEYWKRVTITDIEDVVETCDKQRFELEDGKIRARYGHSIPVIQQGSKRKLPDVLYHGTNKKALEGIILKKEGIKPMGRQYVHLSETRDFAILSARRRESPVLLTVCTKGLLDDGLDLFHAGNEVWLANHVPLRYIKEHLMESI